MHCAGEGTRTPNTQDLNLLPLPIGLHRRHPEGTRREGQLGRYRGLMGGNMEE